MRLIATLYIANINLAMLFAHLPNYNFYNTKLQPLS